MYEIADTNIEYCNNRTGVLASSSTHLQRHEIHIIHNLKPTRLQVNFRKRYSHISGHCGSIRRNGMLQQPDGQVS